MTERKTITLALTEPEARACFTLVDEGSMSLCTSGDEVARQYFDNPEDAGEAEGRLKEALLVAFETAGNGGAAQLK